MHALWLEDILPKYTPKHLLPSLDHLVDPYPPPSSMQGPFMASLQQHCLRALARQLDGSADNWLTSDDAKRLMGPEWRTAIMVQHALSKRSSWTTVKEIFLGQEKRASNIASAEADGSGSDADWLDEEDDADLIPTLAILDLSWSQQLTFQSWLLRSALRSPSASSTLTALSLAGSDLCIRDAVALLPTARSGNLLKLRHLSLAGLRAGSRKEVEEALNTLKQVGDTLEVSF